MRVLVFGGTRGVGRYFVQGAHGQGHQVTVFARDPEAVDQWRPSAVRVVKGDAKDRNAVTAAVPGHDVVVVSLGPTGLERLQHFIGRATSWIVEAMEKAGVRRLLFVSGLGVGRSRREAPAIMRWVAIPTIFRPTFTDRAKGEEIIFRSRLQWTIIRPLYLTDDAPTGRWRATTNGREVRQGIPRADVAAFLLHEFERSDYLRRAVAIQMV